MRKREEEEKKKKEGKEKKTEGDNEKKNEEEREGEEGAAEVRDFNVPFKSLENMHISSVCILRQKSHSPPEIMKSPLGDSLFF